MKTPHEIMEIQKDSGKIAKFLIDNNQIELANILHKLNRLVDVYYEEVSKRHILKICKKYSVV